jgi:hypothetical protein
MLVAKNRGSDERLQRLDDGRFALRWYGSRVFEGESQGISAKSACPLEHGGGRGGNGDVRRLPRLSRALAVACLFALPPLLAGCGGGKRQDVDEPSGTWKVDVISASFPGKQRLAEQSQLRIKVKNFDSRAVPDLAVTVDGFAMRQQGRELSDPSRPIWVVDTGPPNSTTAYTNTWALGRVPSGQTRTFTWTVTAVRAGTYTLRFRVAAGLNGKAKARLPDGSVPTGSFIARVSEKPRPPKID